MGTRFRTALVGTGIATVLLAVLGPVTALVSATDIRPLALAVWAAVLGTWILVVLCAVVVYTDRRTSRMLMTLRRELAAKNNQDVIAEVRDTRVKQSRHEFKQELLLDRIDTNAATLDRKSVV